MIRYLLDRSETDWSVGPESNPDVRFLTSRPGSV